jgi:3-oxoacyl-[acyl-carrier-protein] synthase III
MLDRGPKPWEIPVADIGIRGIGWYWGDRVPIEQMPPLAADAAMLAAFRARGFKHYTRTPVGEVDMIVRSCRETLRRSALCPADIDAVLIGWAEHRWYGELQERMGRRLCVALGFGNIHVVGITLAGCCGFSELLRMARNLIVAEGYRSVLVVDVNRCKPDESDRLVPPDWTIYSDGAASCVVTTCEPEFALRSVVRVSPSVPGHWDTGRRGAIAQRAVSANFAFRRAMQHAGLTRDGVKQYFMPNLGPHLLKHQARQLSIPIERVFLSNIPSIAHAWSADAAINLYTHCQYDPAKPGDRFVTLQWAEGSFAAFVLERTSHPMLMETPEFAFAEVAI